MEEMAYGVKDSLMGAHQACEHHLAAQMEQTDDLKFWGEE
jgi:hypothetical protein